MAHRNWLAAAVCCAFGATAWPVCAGTQSLEGRWRFAVDPEDRGREGRWYEKTLEREITLPGSLQEQGFGDPPSETTPWIARIGKNLLGEARWARYREPGRFRTPFWLTPDRHYLGAAWYQREIDVPAGWAGRRIVLLLERPHWETSAWLGREPLGTRNGLGVPHEYELPPALAPGRHQLTIRVDNRMIIPVGADAHSVSDQTQTAWNGIVGRIALYDTARVWIDQVQVFPDVARRSVRVQAEIGNRVGASGNAVLLVTAESDGPPPRHRAAALRVPVQWSGDGGRVEFDYPLGPAARLWDEFAPALYRLRLEGVGEAHVVRFGLREFGVSGTQFSINGRRGYLRGTLECAVFPLTAYPPTDVESWRRLLRAARAHGLNHLRFHSWTPPEAAFAAADEMGFYYQVEVSAWAPFGDGGALDAWVDEETARTLRAYGNHPSFVLLAAANEPGGRGRDRFLGDWVKRWAARDGRRLYTAGAGWPAIPENQFQVAIQPRIQGTREFARPPQTRSDFRDFVTDFGVPMLSHEIGQWTVYPNFDEIPKYRGMLKPGNLEIFREILERSAVAGRARDFLHASGRFQALFYKAEIEEALRTPGMAGFQLLDLHDFPGQGTAPVGVLDAFWEEKGYIRPEEYRRFCHETVPIARLDRRVFTSDETLHADLEVAHFGPRDLAPAATAWRLRDAAGALRAEGRLEPRGVPTGGVTALGSIEAPLKAIEKATRLSLEVALEGTPFGNEWDVWVYPAAPAAAVPRGIHLAQTLDASTRRVLAAGGRVLLLPGPRRIRGDTFGAFRSIFWNRVTFTSQREHTVGLLTDPDHPALADFPTEFHSNWQWWDLAQRSKPMVLDGLPAGLEPIVQPIDDWNLCRKLGLVLEARVLEGRLLLSSIDLTSELETRPVARQLRRSLLAYMASDAFAPLVALSPDQVTSLLKAPPAMDALGARVVRASSESGDNPASYLLDEDPGTFWMSRRNSSGARVRAAQSDPYPHEVVIAFDPPARLAGVAGVPRQGESAGRIKDVSVAVSDDDETWRELAHAAFDASAQPQTLRFPRVERVRYLRFRALSGHGEGQAALAELQALPAR